ncbi:MAG: gliding motility-associated C-terminal domain-containing protein [Elusimicrobia bacterium]|nr:gliding motility-associated C-terminal domain-containing protein [Elusimicrobiota bacterium]
MKIKALTKKRIGMVGKVIRYIFISLLMSLTASIGYTAGVTIQPPDFTLTDIRIGNTYRVEDLILTKIKFTYIGTQDTIVVKTTLTGIHIVDPYTVLPNDITVSSTPNSFTIANGGTQEVSVSISLPQNVSYLGKKYTFGIYGQSQTGGGTSGGLSQVYLNIGAQYIGYGVTGYSALTAIGLVGDKAYITANVASLTAPTLKFYYRKTGVTAWTTVTTPTTAAKSDGTTDYTFEVPASIITTAGFQYIIESQAGTDYAYVPDQIRSDFLDTAKTKYYDVTVTRTTTGVISTTGSSIIVSDGNPNDGDVKITAPARAVNSNLTVTMEQIDENSSACPAAPDFSLSEKPAMIFKLIPNGTRFLKNIDFSLLYFDTDSNGIVDGLLDRDGGATIQEAKLKMFWWDGFKWRLVNGTQTQDIAKNTITAKINHFSYYALFPVNALSPEDYRPAKKIITPNGDGVNDEADFSGLAEEVKIFDITGRKIRSVAAGLGQWDGKDDDGSVVESGVYIYQYKVDGTLVSGVIAVAK